jgi:hypothetical protein
MVNETEKATGLNSLSLGALRAKEAHVQCAQVTSALQETAKSKTAKAVIDKL